MQQPHKTWQQKKWEKEQLCTQNVDVTLKKEEEELKLQPLMTHTRIYKYTHRHSRGKGTRRVVKYTEVDRCTKRFSRFLFFFAVDKNQTLCFRLWRRVIVCSCCKCQILSPDEKYKRHNCTHTQVVVSFWLPPQQHTHPRNTRTFSRTFGSRLKRLPQGSLFCCGCVSLSFSFFCFFQKKSFFVRRGRNGKQNKPNLLVRSKILYACP